jgi:hypothetical protein
LNGRTLVENFRFDGARVVMEVICEMMDVNQNVMDGGEGGRQRG